MPKAASGDKPKRAPQGPRPCYIPYTVSEDGTVEFGEATRKADALLATIAANPGMKYHRFEVK